MNIKIQDRDIIILQQITKYRFLLARQIKILCGFKGQRACDRRLHKLIQEGYIIRKYYLYGMSALYFATEKSKRMFKLDYITKNVRIEQIQHEINVIDTAIYFIIKEKVESNKIITERQLKNKDGFGGPKHRPDLIILDNNNTTCVEIELNEKAFQRLQLNVKENYKNYDFQIWIVPNTKERIKNNLSELAKRYDLSVLDMEVITEVVKSL